MTFRATAEYNQNKSKKSIEIFKLKSIEWNLRPSISTTISSSVPAKKKKRSLQNKKMRMNTRKKYRTNKARTRTMI